MQAWEPLLLKTLFVLFGLLMLTAGLALLKKGLRPRRKGTDPHCRHCEYNLTGNVSGICPECGHPWTPDAVAIGHRQRSPRRAVAGSLSLLAACLWFLIPVADRIGSFNYFSLLPTRAVLLFVDSSGKGAGQKAVDDIAARLTAGTVTATQAEAFFRKIARFDLKVRKRVIEAECPPYRIGEAIPQVKGVWLEQSFAKIDIDGNPIVNGSSGGYNLDACSYSGSSASSFQPLPLGSHAVCIDLGLQYRWTCAGGVQSTCRYTIPLQDTFEVIPAGSEDTIKLLRNPGLKEQLRQCLKTEQTNTQFRGWRTPLLKLMLVARDSPVDMAFDVFARVQGKEYQLSSATFRKNANDGCEPGGEYMGPDTQAADIILRSDPKVARGTVDMTEIWDGELIYPNVPVTIIQPATTSGSQPAAVPANLPASTASEDE